MYTNKKEYTFEEKVDWLSDYLGYFVEETEIHNPGQFISEVEADFDKLFIKRNMVYVKWNPLSERVVCVHSQENAECPKCKNIAEKLENSFYFLQGSWHEIDSENID
jgi:hypothetical protein